MNRATAADLACRIIGCGIIAPGQGQSFAILLEVTVDMHD